MKLLDSCIQSDSSTDMTGFKHKCKRITTYEVLSCTNWEKNTSEQIVLFKILLNEFPIEERNGNIHSKTQNVQN